MSRFRATTGDDGVAAGNGRVVEEDVPREERNAQLRRFRPGGPAAGPPESSIELYRGATDRPIAVTDTVGFSRTSGFVDDTRAFCSIPARHEVARERDVDERIVGTDERPGLVRDDERQRESITISTASGGTSSRR